MWRSQLDRGQLAHRAELLLAAVAADIGLTSGILTTCVVVFARPGPPHLTADATSIAAGTLVALAFGILVLRYGRSHRGAARFRRIERTATEAPAAVHERANALALATGQLPPEIVVLPDDTVNASSAGAPGSACIMITAGACELEHAQLDALLAYCFAQLASDELRAVRDASAAVSFYARLTKAMWTLIFAGFVLGELFREQGRWVALAGLGTVGVIVGAVCGLAATAAALVLSRAAGALADSDAVEQTMRPDAYADLLIAMAEDRRPTRTELSPLMWLERATTRSDLAAIAASHYSQEELEYRARRMCAIAGTTVPRHWARPGLPR